MTRMDPVILGVLQRPTGLSLRGLRVNGGAIFGDGYLPSNQNVNQSFSIFLLGMLIKPSALNAGYCNSRCSSMSNYKTSHEKRAQLSTV